MSDSLKSVKPVKTKLTLSWSEVWKLVKTTFTEYFGESTFRHAAALAYYTIFALIPMIYLAFYFFGRFLGNDVIFEIISDFLHDNVGLVDVTEIMGLLKQYDVAGRDILMEIVSIGTLLFTSSALVISLRDSINDFLDVEVEKVPIKNAILRTVITRLISIASIGVFGFIIIIIYIAQTVLLSLSTQVFVNETINWLFKNGMAHVFSLASNLLIFMLMFKYVHDGKVKWKVAFYSGLITAVLVYVGQLLIKLYIGNMVFASGMGVVGSILILLTWIFYTGQIIFLGAKFVKIYSNMLGYSVQPEPKFSISKEKVSGVFNPIIPSEEMEKEDKKNASDEDESTHSENSMS